MPKLHFCAAALSLLLLAGCGGEPSQPPADDTPSPAVSHFPTGTERLSLMAENDEIWIQLSADSTLSGTGGSQGKGDLSLIVYTQEGKYIQTVSYMAALSSDTHLIDLCHAPALFVTLADTDGDGHDDLTVLTDQAAGTWRTFLWNEAAGQFAAEET